MRTIFQICLICIIAFAKTETITLPAPIKTGGMGVNRAFYLRKSDRSFSSTGQLSMQELSQLLWACYGINRSNGFKTVPSSKATFPFDVYVYLSTGVYLYDPVKHDLTSITNEDRRAASGGDAFVKNAFADICLAGKYERVKQYGSKEMMQLGIRLDSGFPTQAMYMVAAAEGFKAVVRANFNQITVLDSLNLSIDDYYVGLCFSAGR